MFFSRLRRQISDAIDALDEERFRFLQERIDFRDEQIKQLRDEKRREMALMEARIEVLQQSHDAIAAWVRGVADLVGVGMPRSGETSVEVPVEPDELDDTAEMTLEHIFATDPRSGDPYAPAEADDV